MIINKITTEKGKRVFITNDDYKPIDEVNRYLLYLSRVRMSYNTVLNYGKCLKLFYEYIEEKNETIYDVALAKHPLSYFSEYSDYLEFDKDGNTIRKPETINYIINVVWRYLEFLTLDGVIEKNPIEREYVNKNKYTCLKEFLPKRIYDKRNFIMKKVHAKKLQININKDIYKEIVYTIFPKEKESFYYTKYVTRNLSMKELVQLRNMCIVELMAGTGLRIGEVLGIKLEDLCDMHQGIIYIKRRDDNPNGALAKTGDGYVIASNKIISDINFLICETMKHLDSDYVFVNYFYENIGKPVGINMIEVLFKRITIKLRKRNVISEEDTIHPHMLRHLFATLAVDSCNNVFEVQEFLRHKNSSTTLRYLHMDDEKRIRCAEKTGKELLVYE